MNIEDYKNRLWPLMTGSAVAMTIICIRLLLI